MRLLAVPFALLPAPAFAHGVHVVPMDGHMHGVLPYALGAAAVVALGLVALAIHRSR